MDKTSYKLIDSGNFKRLDKIGPYLIIRPTPQAVWKPSHNPLWKQADAEFIRTSKGEGSWKFYHKIPKHWEILINSKLKLEVKLTDFGHIGFFPEHHQTKALEAAISSRQSSAIKVLNLFAYTGAVSILAGLQGAEVVHVDASKTSVQWAKENAERNSKNELKIRWITDDVKKFVAREVRRNNKYDVIILDPPSFGRGAKGEVWKIEEDLVPLLEQLKELQSSSFFFMQLSAHSPGFTPLTLQNLLLDICCQNKGSFEAKEMTVESQSGPLLPSGASCVYQLKD